MLGITFCNYVLRKRITLYIDLPPEKWSRRKVRKRTIEEREARNNAEEEVPTRKDHRNAA
jgi:hypothetical protein